VHYALFVTYFPHLIAGPILHHRDMIPQFKGAEMYRMNLENLAVALTIFALGLFKKVVIADTMSAFSTPAFGAAAGVTLSRS
jgi:D-alanyl-lipoteichoic acid acyltransferase DltB (MBOAT superfamily)